MTAILGVDLGERRIGVAIADGPGVGARPLTTLPRGRDIGADAAAVRQLVEAHGVHELVIGLPIDAADCTSTRASSVGIEPTQSGHTDSWGVP